MNPKGKKPKKPASQPVSVEEWIASASSKSKLPLRPAPEEPAQASSRDEKPQKPSTDVSTPGPSKGKQPMGPPSQPPVKTGPGSQQTQQVPLGRSKQAIPDPAQPHPKQQARSDTTSKQPREPPAKESRQGNSKGKQPMSIPFYGNPRIYVARIPVERAVPIKRVAVSIGPVTASRHPQTFFFKNLPSLEPYWGCCNDKAWTAQRIVRLEREGKPMPYFLLVCRGEYPKATSPRNYNDVFLDMYEPIFGDAFVFKLGEPELFPDGYARYAHIEEDIGSIEWLPPAIRDAATKVDQAMAPDANPGFPDTTDYADMATMMKDYKNMMDCMRAIKKANRKYERRVPTDEEIKLPDLQRMYYVCCKWTDHVIKWRDGNVLPPKYEPVIDFHEAVNQAFEAIKDAERTGDVITSKSTKVEEPHIEFGKAVQHAEITFLAARSAFLELEMIAKAQTDGIDVNKLKEIIDAMTVNYAAWKERIASPIDGDGGALDASIFDDFEEKARTVIRALEERQAVSEVLNGVKELRELYEKMSAIVEEKEALIRAKASEPDTA